MESFNFLEKDDSELRSLSHRFMCWKVNPPTVFKKECFLYLKNYLDDFWK